MTDPNTGAPAGAEADVMASALSPRARIAMSSTRVAGSARASEATRKGPSDALLASLRHHLLAGETHYPDRPGMAELRRRVGAALPATGFAARPPDGVLITQGEGESLFVTILGLGGGEGATIAGRSGGRHQRLLDWMGIHLAESGDADAAFRLIEHNAEAGAADARGAPDDGSLPQVYAIGDRLFSARGNGADVPSSNGEVDDRPSSTESADALSDVIVIGSLDGLEGIHPFSLGFVAASPAVRPRIAKWKQASSICSPAPSQRAALWAMGVRP